MKYQLFALNIFCLVYSKCPVLNLFKYKSNIESNIQNNVSSNNSNEFLNNSIISSNNILSNNVSDFTNGQATFYFRINDDINGCPNVQKFNTYGSCGVQYNSSSKYWCAIKNSKDYCGKIINVYYKENNINLTVMDECPSCNNNIDMGLEALIELTGSKENACAINQPLPDIKWEILL